MNNSTIASPAPSPTAMWYFLQFATVVYFIVGTYILVALIRYELIKGKFKGPYMTPSFWMKIEAMMSGLCIVGCTLSTQIHLLLLIVPENSMDKTSVCITSFRAHAMLFYLGVISTYIFLWLRQYEFYQNSSFRYLNNTATRIVSGTTITLIVLYRVSSIAVISISDTARWSKDIGCTFHKPSMVTSVYTAVADGASVITTLALFVLFLYPLIAMYKEERDSNTDGSSNNKNEVKSAIRITVVSVVACVLSDFAGGMLTYKYFGKKVPNFFLTSWYDLSLLVNLIALVFTYGESRSILFGCCRNNNESN